MNQMRNLRSIATLLLLLVGFVSGREPVTPDSGKALVHPAVQEERSSEWSFSASVTAYSIPDDDDYASPLFTADRDWFHFEARYNYENIDTASLWLGYNFSLGEKLVLDFTPMLGGVVGQTRGLSPGWRLALSAGDFELTNESEYVFDAENSEDNFFYMWSELTWSPTDWFWVGIVGQRTRLFQSELDIQRGVLVGFTLKEVDFTAYVFNWGWTDPTFVFSVGIEF